MDNVLPDLSELQDLGLPSDQVVSRLERLSQDPASAGRARYWLCRATAAEREGQLDTVLNCFRQASLAQAEPIAELISGLEWFVQRASGTTPAPGIPLEASEDAENALPTLGSGRRHRAGTRTPRRPLPDRSNVFDSSVIKHALTDDTVLKKKLAALRLGAGDDPKTGTSSPLSLRWAARPAVSRWSRRQTRIWRSLTLWRPSPSSCSAPPSSARTAP